MVSVLPQILKITLLLWLHLRTIGASGTREALDLEMQPTTHWYEAWRDTFLHIQYPSDHEFTKHYLACVLVSFSGDFILYVFLFFKHFLL